MLAVSRTKPLHDAVAQMADDLYGGFAPKQGRFGCLPKVISKDAYVSWTEPLHDAMAQTADFAEMQNQQSKQRSTPHFWYLQEVYRQTKVPQKRHLNS